MEFPDAATIDAALESVTFPTFVEARLERSTPVLENPTDTARAALDRLPLERVPAGGTVAVGVGSRGIGEIERIAPAVVDELRAQGFDPVVVPAMGSHGGATSEGQRRTLAALGLSERRLGCEIDGRMATRAVGETASGQPVYVAEAALEADGIVLLNRVKPHTSFEGPVESGLCKMAAVGLGKREGAAAMHERALVDGYAETITEAFAVVRAETPLLGGVAVVENGEEQPAAVEGMSADALPDAEAALLERAKAHLPTLPFDALDVLVIDRIGKDVSGTGMDTNVVARTPMVGASGPEVPEITRIVVRGVSEASHGNAHGIGLADLTTTAVLEELDLEAMYTNALTSGSLELDRLPVALPTEAQALTAAVSCIGPSDPETVRIAWIRDTGHLTRFYVSSALASESLEGVRFGERSRLVFEDGEARLEALESHTADERA
ncbi:nickel pincer cofactor-dependent isomerase, group 22 [Natronobiforma cellulositropha]|uniref:nickel-dependent lactate racemase n=1 Tax=Natronobiforma cellulositropha TaxID=1679076 RepID=UPI0021D60302|nr:nickel-dependent lactate racemase [Natronobiforma cellulositropha]